MTEYLYHQSLRLRNFTAFQDATLTFSPRINAFVGENGSGKTHLLKVLYAFQRVASRPEMEMHETLAKLFQTRNVAEMVRLEAGKDAIAEVEGVYGGEAWDFRVTHPRRDDRAGNGDGTGDGGGSAPGAGYGDESGTGERGNPRVGTSRLQRVERPVFIPAIDMMGHTRGFLQAASEVVLDFDLTCTDIVALLGLERNNGYARQEVMDTLAEPLGGTLAYDTNDSRFYLVTERGRLAIPLVAEGIRKIATLVRLAQNGWLSPGTTLFWDEPEVNLNPKLMDEVIGGLLALARNGVQIFLATHSYVILKELDLQANPQDSVLYFGFQSGKEGTTIHTNSDFALLEPNPILEQYDSLYDRELTRTTGRNRNGERVR